MHLSSVGLIKYHGVFNKNMITMDELDDGLEAEDLMEIGVTEEDAEKILGNRHPELCTSPEGQPTSWPLDSNNNASPLEEEPPVALPPLPMQSTDERQMLEVVDEPDDFDRHEMLPSPVVSGDDLDHKSLSDDDIDRHRETRHHDMYMQTHAPLAMPSSAADTPEVQTQSATSLGSMAETAETIDLANVHRQTEPKLISLAPWKRIQQWKPKQVRRWARESLGKLCERLCLVIKSGNRLISMNHPRLQHLGFSKLRNRNSILNEIHALKLRSVPGRVRKIFDEYDETGTGYIEGSQLIPILKQRKLKAGERIRWVKKFRTTFDKRADHKLDPIDFCRWVNSCKKDSAATLLRRMKTRSTKKKKRARLKNHPSVDMVRSGQGATEGILLFQSLIDGNTHSRRKRKEQDDEKRRRSMPIQKNSVALLQAKAKMHARNQTWSSSHESDSHAQLLQDELKSYEATEAMLNEEMAVHEGALFADAATRAQFSSGAALFGDAEMLLDLNPDDIPDDDEDLDEY